MTSPYHVRISPAAKRQILELPAKSQRIVIKLAEALAINPRPASARKIEGMTGLYFDAIDHTRVIYKIDDQEILLLLVK